MPEIMRCPYCKYLWNCRSKLLWVCCPSCRKPFKREKGKVELTEIVKPEFLTENVDKKEENQK